MFEFFVGKRYLLANSGFASVVTWFSLIGVALGVATLIVVTSVMNGFKEEMLSVMTGVSGHITVMSKNKGGIEKYTEIEKKINAVANVQSAVATFEKHAIMLTDYGARGVLVYAFSDIKRVSIIANNIIAGSTGNAIIGRKLAETQFCLPGKYITLMIPDGKETPVGFIPKEATFLVSGIFSIGMVEYDKNIIVLPLSDAQEFFNTKNAVSYITVFVHNTSVIEKTSDIIRNLLGNGFIVTNINHENSAIFHALKVEKNVMSLILSIIIIVAAFNIISGVTMLTNSKTRDIAMLRAIGATKKSIMKIFCFVGATIGIIGTIAGSILGITVAYNAEKIKHFLEKCTNTSLFSEEVYFLSQLPVKINLCEVVIIICLAFLLCFMATVYPACKAAKMQPVDAFRM